MARSSKKTPFVEAKLLKRIEAMNESGNKEGHKLGEFAPTRTFKGHAGEKATTVKK